MRLKLEGLGRIGKGEVETGRLTIFYGKNHTSKSLLAHGIWGVQRYWQRRIPDFLSQVLYRRGLLFRLWEQAKVERERGRIKIGLRATPTQLNPDFPKWVRELFSPEKLTGYLNRRVFGGEVVKRVELEISPISEFRIDETIYEAPLKSPSVPDEELAVESLIEGTLERGILKGIGEAVGLKKEYLHYLPAARAGFILGLEYIIDGLLHREGGREHPFPIGLTGPLKGFLLELWEFQQQCRFQKRRGTPLLPQLAQWSRRRERGEVGKKLLQFLNSRLLKGEFKLEQEIGGVRQLFSSWGRQVELPLTSTGALELFPLALLFQRRLSPNHFFIIEEPEAHLHPEAQREVARLIALMVNGGLDVLITTHSDYLLYELGNLVRLGKMPPEEQERQFHRWGVTDPFSPSDFRLQLEWVKLYYFSEKGSRVELRPEELI
jgi:hypothetical protein